MTTTTNANRELTLLETEAVSGASWFTALLSVGGLDPLATILDNGIQVDSNHRVGPIKVG